MVLWAYRDRINPKTTREDSTYDVVNPLCFYVRSIVSYEAMLIGHLCDELDADEANLFF